MVFNSGIRDSVVNQLLAKMDGVEQLDNVLVIGLTNRAELIDAALLRPGRLEVQVEVPRPDAQGRQQILSIQSRELLQRGCLAPRAAACLTGVTCPGHVGPLARVTGGFSGADLAGLMRSVTSYSLERYVDEALLRGWDPGAAKPPAVASSDDGEEGLLEVRYEDIERALREASPRKTFSRRTEAGAQGEARRRGGGRREVLRRLREWWRESRLSALTDKAVAGGTGGAAEAAARLRGGGVARLRGAVSGVTPAALWHARCRPAVAQTADLACDEESCDDERGKPPAPGLTAPGERFVQAVYTKSGGEGGEAEGDVALAPRPALATAYPPIDDALLAAIVDAAERAVADPDPGGQEAYGDWVRAELRAACAEALLGLRGRKLAWWLDAPRPLRAVAARGAKYEVSVVALPGGCTLPPAAFPRGSVLFCVPLLGQFTVRRLRFDITGKTSTPIELMKRVLKSGAKPCFLAGGCCHSFEGVPGVASAFLQLAMMPPTSSFPPGHCGGEGSIGWRRPPGESCEENTDVVSGVCIGVEKGVRQLALSQLRSALALSHLRRCPAPAL